MHSDDSTEQVPQIKEKLSEAELFEEDSSTDLENATKEVPAPLAQEDDIEYPTGLKLALIILGDFIAIFLVALVSLGTFSPPSASEYFAQLTTNRTVQSLLQPSLESQISSTR